MTVLDEPQAGARGGFFFLIVCHFWLLNACLTQTLAYVDQIPRQSQPKQYCQNGDKVDDKSGGLEFSFVELRSRFAVAHQAGDYHHDSRQDGSRSHPDGKARCPGLVALKRSELPHGDGEASDGETEDHNRDAGANPREECALVG